MFDEIIVSRSVYEESVIQGQGKPGAIELERAHWIQVQEPQARSSLPPSLLGLDQGELDTILLAQELSVDQVLIDEKLGRKVAKSQGLSVQGTLGLLLAAHRGGLLDRDEALEALEALEESSIRLSGQLIAWFEAQLHQDDGG
jgi:predicted nucleic acid-binding protein